VPKLKELRGVAHDIAHHAASGLSCISPHMAQALRSSNIETTTIELLSEEPYPERVVELEPLRMALHALRKTMLEISSRRGFQAEDFQSVRLHATPAPWDQSGYLLHIKATIVASNGNSYESKWIDPLH
jgi:hypothetical protein